MGGRGQKLVSFDTLRHPTRSDYVAPDTLPASCERHGRGSVSTRDVLGAPANIVLKLSATS
jgi:hypothetical protein